jgi:hypothetical protein
MITVSPTFAIWYSFDVRVAEAHAAGDGLAEAVGLVAPWMP